MYTSIAQYVVTIETVTLRLYSDILVIQRRIRYKYSMLEEYQPHGREKNTKKLLNELYVFSTSENSSSSVSITKQQQRASYGRYTERRLPTKMCWILNEWYYIRFNICTNTLCVCVYVYYMLYVKSMCKGSGCYAYVFDGVHRDTYSHSFMCLFISRNQLDLRIVCLFAVIITICTAKLL